MCAENNQNQENELEQIIASSRQAARDAVAGAFREELGHAMEPGAKVMSADRELRYCLELQRDRIARKNIRFTEEFDQGKKPVRSAVNNVRSWQDGHYETSLALSVFSTLHSIQTGIR